MSITLPPKFEKFIDEQIQSGRFSDPSEVVIAALQAMEDDPLRAAPVFPVGSLQHLYTPEANSEEAKLAPPVH